MPCRAWLRFSGGAGLPSIRTQLGWSWLLPGLGRGVGRTECPAGAASAPPHLSGPALPLRPLLRWDGRGVCRASPSGPAPLHPAPASPPHLARCTLQPPSCPPPCSPPVFLTGMSATRQGANPPLLWLCRHWARHGEAHGQGHLMGEERVVPSLLGACSSPVPMSACLWPPRCPPCHACLCLAAGPRLQTGMGRGPAPAEWQLTIMSFCLCLTGQQPQPGPARGTGGIPGAQGQQVRGIGEHWNTATRGPWSSQCGCEEGCECASVRAHMEEPESVCVHGERRERLCCLLPWHGVGALLPS